MGTGQTIGGGYQLGLELTILGPERIGDEEQDFQTMDVTSGKPIEMVAQRKARKEASFQRRLEEMGLTKTEYKKR